MAIHRNPSGSRPLTRRPSSLTALAPVFALTAAFAVASCAPSEPPPSAGGVEDPLAGYRPAAADREAILAPLQALFDALETGDADLLRSVVAPGVLMSFVETRDGATTRATVTLDQLAERITSSPVPLIERMWDPVVVVEGDLAMIWTPYDFYAGEELSHCGVDAATLLRGDAGWTIVGLSWTRDQPPACDLHPEGPPVR